MTYTPGPWSITEHTDDIIASDGTHVVCFGHDYDDYGGIKARVALLGDTSGSVSDWHIDVYNQEKAANARLIAAAPDLLAACKAFLDAPESDNACYTVEEEIAFDAMRAAIAKAEGVK